MVHGTGMGSARSHGQEQSGSSGGTDVLTKEYTLLPRYKVSLWTLKKSPYIRVILWPRSDFAEAGRDSSGLLLLI